MGRWVLLGLLLIVSAILERGQPAPEVRQAAAGWIVLAVVAGLSAIASVLFKPKVKSPIQDKEPTVLATRGAYAPWIQGRRRTGHVFGWAGERETVQDGGAGGKGGGKGGGGGGITVYYEAGWHHLCVGPASVLYRIWQDGKVIYEPPIPLTPGNTPSGSSVNLGSQGTFRIYWGEKLQPIDNYLADPNRVGVASRWPYLCHIVWEKKRLGPSPRWPNMEYDLEVSPFGVTQLAAPGYIAPSAVGETDDGFNPAHIFESMAFEPFPHGLGMDRTLVDMDSLEELAQLAFNERLAFSVVSRDGDTAESVLASLLVDVGCMVPMVDGLMRFVPIRTPEANQPIISEDLLLQPRPEIDNTLDERPVDHMVFAFHNRDLQFRQGTIEVDDDGQASLVTTKRGRTIGIESTVNFNTAAIVADRRSLEELAGTTPFKIYSNRASRKLYPGMTILVSGIQFLLRIATVKPDPLSGRVVIQALIDYYGADPTGYLPPGFIPSGPSQPPVPDVQVGGSHPPHKLESKWTPPVGGTSGGTIELFVPRIRAHRGIYGAEIWASSDDSSFYRVGTDLTRYQGGTLTEAIAADDPFVIEMGPIYVAAGVDEADVLDLSSDPTQWRLGRQIAIIGGEVFFLRNIEAQPEPNRYRLRGLMRARLATRREAHAVDAEVFIAQVAGLSGLVDPMFVEGQAVYLKTVPFSEQGGVDISAVSSVKYDIPKHVPFGAVNFRTPTVLGHTNAYESAVGLGVKWSYISTDINFPRTGAGFQNAGEPVAAFAPPMGTFDIELLDMAMVSKLLVTGLTASVHTFTPSEVQTAFGGAFPSQLKARIRETVGPNAGAWGPAIVIHKVGP